MISFEGEGLYVDEDGWHTAEVRGAFIRVRFRNGARIVVDEQFLLHALELLKFDRERSESTVPKESVE